MDFNVYNILIIAGIIQGFIFTGVVLFNKKYHAKSTYFLVALIFIYSLGNLMYILPDIGVMSLLTMYAYFFLPLASIIPVIIYFYVMFFLYPSKKITFIEKLLFVPFTVFLVLILFFRLKLILGYIEINPINQGFRLVVLTNEVFSVLYSITLLIIVFIKINIYEKHRNAFDKKIIRPDVKWLKITLYIIFFFTFVWAYLTIKNIFLTQGEANFYVLWISVAYLIYWLGHIGIYKYGIIADRKKIRKYLNDNISVSQEKNSSTSSYSSSKHTNQYILDLENLLVNEKIYLDSNLTLENVAENLKLSPSYLSRIIHNELNTSFPDYLNSYRIEEAKKYLKNPDFAKYTIVSIGLEAGFNSKSSFYNVFKKATGKTPLAYQKEKVTA